MGVIVGRPRIEIHELEVRLGESDILNGVDLEVNAGELLAIIGPNGAGKSTLLRALDGLQAAQRGRVEVDGRKVSEYRRRDLARVVSFVPQTDVPADDWGQVNASFNTLRNVAGALGIAAALAILSSGPEKGPEALVYYDRTWLFFTAGTTCGLQYSSNNCSGKLQCQAQSVPVCARLIA